MISLAASVQLHLIVAAVFVSQCELTPPNEPIGSEWHDVDLLAPRLAPPLSDLGFAVTPGRPRADGRSRDRRGGRAEKAVRDDQDRDPRQRASSTAQQDDWIFHPAAVEQALVPSMAAPSSEESARSEARSAAERLLEELLRQTPPQTESASVSRDGRSAAAREERCLTERSPKAASDAAKKEHPRSETQSDSPTESATAISAQPEPEEVLAQQIQEHRDLHQDRRAQRRAGSSEEPEEIRAGPAATSARAAPTGQKEARRDRRGRDHRNRQHKAMDRELPEEPSLTSLNALVHDVKQAQTARDARHRRFLRAKRRHDARVNRKFASLVRRTSTGGRTFTGVTSAVANASGPAASLAGHQGRHAEGDQGVKGGRPDRLGMKFYISGRRVKHSRVVRPPELLSIPKIRCRINSLMVTPATVRMLVEVSGKVGFAYIKHSSSSKVFDRCALRHTKQMRFKPGEDQHGVPLNVWINVRVEPSTLSAGL